MMRLLYEKLGLDMRRETESERKSEREDTDERQKCREGGEEGSECHLN